MSYWFQSFPLLLLWMGMFTVVVTRPTASFAADAANIEVSMRLDNISGFSTKEKTYSVDGTIWPAHDPGMAQVLETRNIKPTVAHSAMLAAAKNFIVSSIISYSDRP